MLELIHYSELESGDFSLWLEMGLKLWKDSNKEDLKVEFEDILKSKIHHSFLAKNEKNAGIGFVNISIRKEYVTGSKSCPTGYIEGIYVELAYRNKGVARKLIELSESWFLEKGCKQIGSDTWDWNKESQEFHERIGFVKKATLVHFLKDIKV